MADATQDESAAREVGWYRDLLAGTGNARVLDKDLRGAMVQLLRGQATSEGLWARESDQAGAVPEEPTVEEVRLSKFHLLRGTDVVVSWDGLAPPAASVTVIAPDGSEQRDVPGTSVALRIDRSGPITLRLNNRGRVADVRAGLVEAFVLPAFTIPRVLPPVPKAQLPPVRIPSQSVAALEVPVPHLAVGSAARLVRQVRDTTPATKGAAARIAGIFTDAGMRVADMLRRATDHLWETVPRFQPGGDRRH